MFLVIKKDCKIMVIDTENLDKSNLSSQNKTDMMQEYVIIGVVDKSDIPMK